MTSLPTFAIARASRPELAVGESDTFLLLELLCGRRRRERWQQPPEQSAPSSTLAMVMARTTGAGMLRFLHSQGAERDDDVLRDHHDGRSHQPVALSHDPAGLSLAVSSAWPDFVWRLSTVVMPFSVQRRQAAREDLPSPGRAERQVLRKALASSTLLTAGDHLAMAMAIEHAARLDLPELLSCLVVRSLASTSPLAALYQLDDPELDDAPLSTLVLPPLLRVFELIAPGASLAWSRQLDLSRRTSGDADELVARAQTLTRRLRRLLVLLNQAQRLDLASVVVDFAQRLGTVLPVDTRAQLVRLPGVVTMADRDRVVGAVASVFVVVDDLEALGHAVGSTRYGDERWQEARLVRGWADRLRAARPAIAASRQALVGAIG